VPGEVLYSFKIQVTENIEKLLAYSDSAKTDFAVTAAEQRLIEIQTLLAKGSLDSATEVQLTDTFDSYAAEVSDQIQVLETNGDYVNAARTAANFRQVLTKNITALSSTNTDGVVAMQTFLTPLINHLQITLDSVSALSADITAKTPLYLKNTP
jgi:hypothetical protein